MMSYLYIGDMDKYEFWITIAGILAGVFGVTVKLLLKSKCEDVNLCYGMCNVHRNVNVEEELELQLPQSPR